MIYTNKIGETFYEQIWVGKGGRAGGGGGVDGRGDGRRRVRCMLHELYGVVVCRLKNMCNTV